MIPLNAVGFHHCNLIGAAKTPSLVKTTLVTLKCMHKGLKWCCHLKTVTHFFCILKPCNNIFSTELIKNLESNQRER